MSYQNTGTGTPTAVPVSLNDSEKRIFSIDVLRGLAILGILVISIWEFGGFSLNEQTRLRLLHKGLDYSLFGHILIFFEGKMKALFALVFGTGMMLYLTRPNQFTLPQTHEYYIRRQFWLMAFGVIAAFAILWPGDILFHLGVMGVLLFPFARMSRKGLLIAALICTVIYCGKMFWNYADDKKALRKYTTSKKLEEKFKKDSTERHRKDSIAGMPIDSIKVRDSIGKKNDTLTRQQKMDKERWEGITKGLKYDSTKGNEKAEKEAMRSGYGKVWNHLLRRSQEKESVWLYKVGFWEFGSLIFLGMALFGYGYFNNNFSKNKYLLFGIAGIVIGFLLGWWRLELVHDKIPDYEKYIKGHIIAPNQFFPIENIVMTFGYVSLVLWLIRINILKWLWKGLNAVGRMAFTNYFIQIIFCTCFFYGYGFGYFGRLSQLELYYLVIEIWLVQTVFSVLWLRFYHYGPVEWLWRWLIYAKRFPNKKKTV
jgi:uncharacterized protein